MQDRFYRRSDFSERVIIVVAGVVTCALASAHAIWHAAVHHVLSVDPNRLILCLSLILIAFWAGYEFYLLQWHGLPRNAPPRRLKFSPKYRNALRDGVFIHLVALVFASTILMAGIDRLAYSMLLADLVGVLLLISRRPEFPTVSDLVYVRFGFLGLMGVVLALLVFVSSLF